MDKLIIIMSILVLFACTNQVERGSYCQAITDIGIQEIQSYLKTLDTIEAVTPNIIEYRINNKGDYFYADMFVSKPYLMGQEFPRLWHKMSFEERDIYLLVYCNNLSLSNEDSLNLLKEIRTENLVVDDVLDWTKYGEWSTHDFGSFKFIFCKDDVSNFTVNTRVQEIENNLEKPNCF